MALTIKARINSKDGSLRIKSVSKFRLDKDGGLHVSSRVANRLFVRDMDGALIAKDKK